EVAQAYQEAVEHLNAFRASEQAALAARKWLVSALSTFDMGVGQAKDIFLALDRYGKNRGDYLSSLLNYHLALARLSYAIGAYRTQAEGGPLNWGSGGSGTGRYSLRSPSADTVAGVDKEGR